MSDKPNSKKEIVLLRAMVPYTYWQKFHQFVRENFHETTVSAVIIQALDKFMKEHKDSLK